MSRTMIKKESRFLEMSAKEYRELLGISKPTVIQKENKYHAHKTEVDGVKFDSIKESRDWKQLCMLEAAGGICNLRRQVTFELQPKFTNNKGEHIRAINYIADFVYEKDGKKYVQDSKGGKATQTDVFKLKHKLFEYKYPEYIFVVS